MEQLDARDCDFKLAETRGEAKYVADRIHPGMLVARFYRANVARGQIKSMHLPQLPEGYTLFGSDDIPGENALRVVNFDWPLLAKDEVRYFGQEMLLFVGPDADVLDQLIQQTHVEYLELPAVAEVDEAAQLFGGPIHSDNNRFGEVSVIKGDIEQAIATASRVVEECCESSFQEHSYIEPQGMLAYRDNIGRITIEGSMQCPVDVHHAVAHLLGIAQDQIRVVHCPTGGGFGGKEDYPYVLACALALVVYKLGQPVQMIYDRVEDMQCTTKRHPCRTRFRTALDENNTVLGIDILIELNGGAYESLSNIVLQRAVTSITGAYQIPHQRIHGIAWATNTVPSGAFRGFGAPQACFAIENHMQHLADCVGEDAAHFKRRHLIKQGDILATGAPLHDPVLTHDLLDQALQQSDYLAKRKRYGAQHGRGIGLSVVFHGCGMAGDCEQNLVGARAGIEKGADERVTIRASNVDIGQGLSLTFCKIVAKALDLPLSHVHYPNPDTSVVPDSGPTVASRSIQVVGYLLEKAARRLKSEWRDGELQYVEEQFRQPDYHQWDQANFTGNPYLTNSWAVSIVEVEVDPCSGEVTIVDVWGSYDIGRPIDRRVFEGQIDGGMAQALGWAYCEKLELKEGRFAQHTMADYTIPTAMDLPRIRRDFIENLYPYGPFGAKGGGELTIDGGAPAFVAAVEQAVGQAFHSIPLTPERIMERL